MTPQVLLGTVDAAGIVLWIDGQDLRYRAPKGALTDDLRQAIRQHKAELLTLLAAPVRVADTPQGTPRVEAPAQDATPSATVASEPCSHARTGRRPDGTLVCLACVAVYANGVWTPQTIAYCATAHVPYDPTLTDGPTRQCQRCPHVWQVPCSCGMASWKPSAQWGEDGTGTVQWTCNGCGAIHGADQVSETGPVSSQAHRTHEAAAQAL